MLFGSKIYSPDNKTGDIHALIIVFVVFESVKSNLRKKKKYSIFTLIWKRFIEFKADMPQELANNKIITNLW